MKVVLVLREPMLDRIPNLKSTIEYLAGAGDEVVVFTAVSPKFVQAGFENKNVTIHLVNERSRLLELPTLLKLILSLLRFDASCNFRCKTIHIFAGRGALILLALGKAVRLFSRSVAFIVEYPNYIAARPMLEKLLDRFELSGISQAEFFIAHDRLHGDFINGSLLGSPRKYMALPNATLGGVSPSASGGLRRRLGLGPETRVLLHAGGFGPWFSSKELAKVSSQLPENCTLVFHMSHSVLDDDYYKEYLATRDVNDRSALSTEAVRSSQLDSLFIEAHVGVAWYDLASLGFRASLMGLAAGKIGNYLKCGIPVIAPKIESLKYIEEYECGILISEISDVPAAYKKIDNDIEIYRRNALRCFEEVWNPGPYLNAIRREMAVVEASIGARSRR